MAKQFNKKFFLTGIILFIAGLLSRPVLLGAGVAHDYFVFFSSLIVGPAVFFVMASLWPDKHSPRQANYLVAGVAIIKGLTEAGNYNTAFYASMLGVLLGLVVIQLSFIPRIRHWFVS